MALLRFTFLTNTPRLDATLQRTLQNLTAPMCCGTEGQNIGLHALVERFNR